MSREGTNPAKDARGVSDVGAVRLIVPLHVPAAGVYFRDGWRVFEAMLESIAATTDERVRISVLDNQCSEENADSLDRLLRAGVIDRIVHGRNVGKRNSVVSELKATPEQILIVADGDVVFRSGWVDVVLSAMAAFPEVGMLSMHPAPDLQWLASAAVIATARRNGAQLSSAQVMDGRDYSRFAQSIGRTPEQARVEQQMVVRRGDAVLMLGFSHFAFALRRDALDALPAHPSTVYPVGTAMEEAADQAGWWCLSVPRALVHHVGNTLDGAERARICEFTQVRFTDSAGLVTVCPQRQPNAFRIQRSIVEKLISTQFGRALLLRSLFSNADLAKKPGSAFRFSGE